MTRQTTTHRTDVRAGVIVQAPPNRAFAVFTERSDEWWPRPHRLGTAERLGRQREATVGGRWYERTVDGKEGNVGRVLAWDPPSHVALSWQIAPGFSPEAGERRASRLDVRFIAKGPDRTSVTVVHSEFERHGPEWRSMREGVSGDAGWPGILQAFAALASETTGRDAGSRSTPS